MPAGQSSHALAFVENVPEPQAAQLTELLATATFPTSHSMQPAWPEAPCALPAGQLSQVVELDENVPEPQAVQLAAPALGVIEPGKQLEQNAEPPVEKFPGLQRLQVTAPAPLAFPASHA